MAIAALLAFWACADLLYVTVDAEVDQSAPASAILVLGCKAYENGAPTPCIRARASHAAELFHRNLAPYVIASGGPSKSGPAEAGVLAMLLQQDGVPPSAIVEEAYSHNTIQNMYNTRTILQARGWGTVLLVTEPYHIKRAALIARDAGLSVRPSPAVDSPDWQRPFARVASLVTDAVSGSLRRLRRPRNYD